MERHYILASHGTFSQGIYDAVRIILGEKKHVHILSAYVREGQDITALVEEVMQVIPQDSQIIVCTDVFGGSVNNEFMKYIGNDHFYLMSGMNLPMLMNLFLHEDKDIDTLLRILYDEGRTGIICCNKEISKASTEDEF